MKAHLKRLAERIDAATLRERALIFIALLVLVAAFMDTVFIDAQVTKEKRLRRDIAGRQAETAAVQDKLGQLVRARAADPDRALRERLERLREETTLVENRIREERRRFTDPRQMRAVLEEMLARNGRVALINMRSLETTRISDPRPGPAGASGVVQAKPAADAAARPEREVYRHGIELQVSGAYLDLLAYLKALEQLPTQLYWGGAELSAETHPVVTLKVTVYTLSLDKSWLNV